MDEYGNPAGYQANGRPFGVTFAGKAFSEAALIRIAYAFEQHTKQRTSFLKKFFRTVFKSAIRRSVNYRGASGHTLNKKGRPFGRPCKN